MIKIAHDIEEPVNCTEVKVLSDVAQDTLDPRNKLLL